MSVYTYVCITTIMSILFLDFLDCQYILETTSFNTSKLSCDYITNYDFNY